MRDSLLDVHVCMGVWVQQLEPDHQLEGPCVRGTSTAARASECVIASKDEARQAAEQEKGPGSWGQRGL